MGRLGGSIGFGEVWKKLLLRNSEGASARIRLKTLQKPTLTDNELAGMLETLRTVITSLLKPINSEPGSVQLNDFKKTRRKQNTP